jgi:hypothetical protein
MTNETPSAQFVASGVGHPGSSVSSEQKGEFRKEGEYWIVGYGGKSFRLKDTKGLGYVAHLLRHPPLEFHVLDLAGGIAGQRDDDETREAAYRLPRGAENLEKAGIIPAVWVTRARSSTSRLKSLIDAGSPSCATGGS